MMKKNRRDVRFQDAFCDEMSYAEQERVTSLDPRWQKMGRALMLSDYHRDFFALASNPSLSAFNIEMELHEVDFTNPEFVETYPWIDLYVGRGPDDPKAHSYIQGLMSEGADQFWRTIGEKMKNVRSENGKYNFYFDVGKFVLDERVVTAFVENQSDITRETLLECARAFAYSILKLDIPMSRMFFAGHDVLYGWVADSPDRATCVKKLEAGLMDSFRDYQPDMLKELGFPVEEKLDMDVLAGEGLLRIQSSVNGSMLI